MLLKSIELKGIVVDGRIQVQKKKLKKNLGERRYCPWMNIYHAETAGTCVLFTISVVCKEVVILHLPHMISIMN